MKNLMHVQAFCLNFMLMQVSIILGFVISACCALRFDLQPRSQDVVDKQPASLSCGLPSPNDKLYTISWVMNNKPVRNTHRRLVCLFKLSLYIHQT